MIQISKSSNVKWSTMTFRHMVDNDFILGHPISWPSGRKCGDTHFVTTRGWSLTMAAAANHIKLTGKNGKTAKTNKCVSIFNPNGT